MAHSDETATVKPTIRIVEFIAKLDHQLPQSLIVKHSNKVDGASHLQDIEGKLKKNIDGDQHLKLTSKCILKQGSDLDIEIHRKHSLQHKIFSFGHISDDPLCRVSIKFNDLWDHLVSETQKGTKSNFKVEFPNGIPGLQFWIVAEAHDCQFSALVAQIKGMMEDLNRFQSILHRLGPARDAVGMIMELGKPLSGLNSIASKLFTCIEIVYQHFETQEESHEAMKNLVESMIVLAGQLNRLKEVPQSDTLHGTINEFPSMMEEVINFIQTWLENWTVKHILVVAQKEEASGLQKKLDAFAQNFDRDLLIEIRAEQATAVKDIRTDIANVQENVKVVAERKGLDDLARALGENRLALRKPCMEGTRTTILQEIENGIQSVDGRNVIWIRGSPGVGKSALAASIAARLRAHPDSLLHLGEPIPRVSVASPFPDHLLLAKKEIQGGVISVWKVVEDNIV